jgi:hypothetical protein
MKASITRCDAITVLGALLLGTATAPGTADSARPQPQENVKNASSAERDAMALLGLLLAASGGQNAAGSSSLNSLGMLLLASARGAGQSTAGVSAQTAPEAQPTSSECVCLPKSGLAIPLDNRVLEVLAPLRRSSGTELQRRWMFYDVRSHRVDWDRYHLTTSQAQPLRASAVSPAAGLGLQALPLLSKSCSHATPGFICAQSLGPIWPTLRREQSLR